MPTEWTKVGSDVLAIADEIIDEFRPELKEFNIGFIFRSEASSAGGKLVFGQAAKIPPKLALFTDLDAFIWLAQDYYRDASELQKRALIHHELCHFEADDDGGLSLRGHDIEEFEIIVRLYGLWKSDLLQIAPAFVSASQPVLPGMERLRRTGGVVAVEPGMLVVNLAEAE